MLAKFLSKNFHSIIIILRQNNIKIDSYFVFIAENRNVTILFVRRKRTNERFNLYFDCVKKKKKKKKKKEKKKKRKKREAEDGPDTATNCWAGDVAGDGLPFRFSGFRSECLGHFQSKPKLDDWMGIESRPQLRTTANASVTQTRRERVLPAPRTRESVLLAGPRSGPFDSPYIMNGSPYVRITREREREKEREKIVDRERARMRDIRLRINKTRVWIPCLLWMDMDY